MSNIDVWCFFSRTFGLELCRILQGNLFCIVLIRMLVLVLGTFSQDSSSTVDGRNPVSNGYVKPWNNVIFLHTGE